MTAPDPDSESSREVLPVDAPELETVLRAVFGLRESESSAYLELLRTPDGSAAEVARELGRDRSNVDRSLRTLRDHGLASRRRVLFEEGGHVYRYRPRPLPEVRDRMHDALDEWTDTAHERVEEFGADTESPPSANAESAELYASRAED